MLTFSLNFVFFFFKQKTAYELRISDWSSDVCSSDLYSTHLPGCPCAETPGAAGRLTHANTGASQGSPPFAQRCPMGSVKTRRLKPGGRSEEHTSELQSLMRISYAVFCLNNKNQAIKQEKNTPHEHTLIRTTN